MAQIFGNGDDIESVGQQNRGQRMPEGVGGDVGKIVFGGKIPEPAGYSIRSGRTAIFPTKYIAALEKLYDGKIQELECAMEDIGGDLAATKEEFGNQLNKLNENLVQLNKTQEIYQKKMETRFLLLSICGGVGILLAIILAGEARRNDNNFVCTYHDHKKDCGLNMGYLHHVRSVMIIYPLGVAFGLESGQQTKGMVFLM